MSKIVAIDFDGTIVEHRYPDIGNPVPYALESIKKLMSHGVRIILWTMRSGESLDHAVNYLKENSIELYGINVNESQSSWTLSPKVYAHYYVDDAAIGCPLIESKRMGGRPMVDWSKVMEELCLKLEIKDE